MAKVFNYLEYKPYLIHRAGERGRRTGLRAQLAKFVGCQAAYVSQVLVGSHHFSLEQAERINRFLHHDPQESHYFMLLLQKDRAGTRELQEYFGNQIQKIRAEREQIKSRVPTSMELGPEEMAKYYSSWLYSAIHIALSIPQLGSHEKLVQHLHIPPETCSQVLSFLESCGLAQRDKDDNWSMGPCHVHLPRDSEHIVRHHTNWRLRALNSLDHSSASDIHYSVVVSLSEEDADRLKANLLGWIEENMRIVKDSPEETLRTIVLDYFSPRS